MAKGLQTQLSRKRRPLGEPLRLGFQYEVVLTLPERTGNGAAKGDFPPGQVLLTRVIDIDTGNIQRLRRRKMVDSRLHAIGVAAPFKIEVVGDELMRLGIFTYDVRLPGEVLGHLLALVAGERAGEAGVNGIFDRRKILPAIDAVAPVVQTKIFIQPGEIGILFPQAAHKTFLHIAADIIVMLGFVIQLPANNRRMVLHVRHQSADNLFGVAAKGRVDDIHDLPRTIFLLSVDGGDQNVRMFSRQPGRDGVSRRADNHRDPRFMHSVQHPVDMVEVILAFLRLQRTPGRFGNPHHVNARFAH